MIMGVALSTPETFMGIMDHFPLFIGENVVRTYKEKAPPRHSQASFGDQVREVLHNMGIRSARDGTRPVIVQKLSLELPQRKNVVCPGKNLNLIQFVLLQLLSYTYFAFESMNKVNTESSIKTGFQKLLPLTSTSSIPYYV